MANGYIGKISAVVTANTSYLSRKLAGAVTNVDNFANRLAASVERSSQQAQNSLNNIFTPLQRLERNLQAGLSGNVFNRENVDQYVRSVRQAVSISEQINKPLAGGASAFQKLSLEVQAAFLPALNRAQGAVVNLSTTLQQQGSVSERSFGQVEQVVNRTTAAIRRLAQAQQLASQSLTGNELQFSNPRLFQTLSESARVTQSAAALPAAQLEDGSIARQVRALQQYRNAAVEANAAVESLRLEPNVNPDVVLAAERRLQGLIETARRAGEQVRNSVEIAENIGASTQLRSDTDPTGRTIQQRVADINRAREAEQAAAAAAAEAEAAQRRIADVTRTRLAVASQLLQVDERETQLITRQGEAVNIRDRVQGQAAIRRAVEEEAAFRQRAADAAEREAAATIRTAEALNRFDDAERNRRTGATNQRLINEFEAGLVGIDNFAPRQTRRFIGIEEESIDRYIRLVGQLDARFQSLSQSAQQALGQQAAALNRAANNAIDGGGSAAVRIENLRREYLLLADAIDLAANQTRRLAIANEQLVIAPDQEPPPPPRTDVRERVQRQGAIRRAIEEEAAFRQRAADAAEREAAAVEWLSQSQNRLLAQEIQRNTGASARRNAAAFDAATAGVLNRQAPDAGVFERQTRTLDSELQRTAQLRQQFLALPEDVQQSLEGERAALNNIGTAARDGAASLGVLAEANDRMAASIASANEQLSEQARLSRANAQLAIDPDQPPPLPPPPTDLGNRLQQAGADRIRALTGSLNIDSTPVPGVFNEQAQRDIDALATRVGGVRQQLETLPNSVRTQFIPALEQATQELVRLQNAPASTAEEIDEAARAVQRLENGLARVNSFGGSGVTGINLWLNQRVLQGFESQLLVLQGVIAGVAGEARGDLAAAFDAVRNSITAAMNDGTIATQETQRSIAEMIRSLSSLSATASDQSVARVLQQVARAGDVGRRGLDRFSLAAAQAGFAIDDFFSVTGDFSQRLRAVSNNVTQLAFILGGTQGLFIGLAAVLAGQAAVAITKWVNSGRTAEDKTKALNESLARQKSLVESLAESFRELGDSLTRGTLSQQAEDARAFAQSVERAARARREINEENILENDPVIRTERANQARIDREIAAASDAAVRTGLQAQRDVSEQRVRNRRGVLRLPAPDDFEVEQTLRRRAPNPFRGNVPDLPGGNELSSLRARRDALEQPLDRLRQILSDGPSFGDGGLRFGIASQSFDELNSLASRLDAAISDAVDGIATDVAQNARAPAARLADAQQKIAQAVEAGLGGAASLASLLDQAGNQFRNALDQLNSAVQLTDPAEREQAIAEARRSLEAATLSVDAETRKVAAIDIARQALDRFAEALERASQEVQRNLSSAQSAADEARAADLGRSTSQSQSQRQQAEADLRRQQELASAAEEEIAASRERFNDEAARQAFLPQDVERRRTEATAATQSRIDPLLARQRQLQEFQEADLDLSAAFRASRDLQQQLLGRYATEQELDTDPRFRGVESEVEKAFQRFIQLQNADQTLPRRKDISNELDAIAAEIQAAQGQFEETLAGLDAELQAAGGELVASFRRIAEIDSLLQTQGVLGEGQREELVRERAKIEQQAVEQDAAVQAAVDESTREEQRRRQAERGRQLAQTPGQRAAESLASDLDAVRQFFGRQAEEGSGLVDFEAQNAAQGRLVQDAFRSQAPAIAGLADSVANALLQGPSRAALNATDVSTVEGARELNRLIRGDDAARDQNLEELRRQSGQLQELIQAVRDNGGDIAN